VALQASVDAGSFHFHYKTTHSLVLLVVVDALYNFVIVDIGASGRQSDGYVFARSLFGHLLKTNPFVATGLASFGVLSTTSASCVCGWRGVSPATQLDAPLSWATVFYRS